VRPIVKKVVIAPPEPVLYNCASRAGRSLMERIANAQGNAVCLPVRPKSHRVPGPVRGFKKMRRAQWSRLRRVEE